LCKYEITTDNIGKRGNNSVIRKSTTRSTKNKTENKRENIPTKIFKKNYKRKCTKHVLKISKKYSKYPKNLYKIQNIIEKLKTRLDKLKIDKKYK